MARRFLSNVRINDAYTLPASDGTNNQVIKTDGSGNLTFGQLATDSASVIYKDTFTGDGSTTAFTMANALNDENQSNIYIDGVYQSKSTYSVVNKVITFSTAPASGHAIEVISTTGINSGPTAIFTDNFTANGSTTAFTLGQTVHDENQTLVFLNGVYQFKNTYTLSGTTLTLDTAPANGVAIEVMSIGSAYSGGDILYDHDFTSAGLMKTNGSGTYSIVTDNSSNWNTAYTYSQVGHLPLAGGTVSGNLIVTGDLTINGNTTTLSTQTIEVEDNILQLNTTQGTPDTATAATSGISIYRGNGVAQASFIFDDGDDTWDLTNNLKIAGNLDVDGTEITVGTNGSIFAENNLRFKSSGAAYIDHNTTGQSIVFRTSTSSSLDTTALTLTNAGNATFAGNVTAGSFIKSGGTSSQYLMADGSVSTITNNVTGTGVNNRLAIWNGTTAIDSDSDFYVDGDTIFTTNLEASGSGTFGGNIRNTSGQILPNELSMGDNKKILIGNGDDLQLYHNGTTSNSNIENYTGGLYITNYTDDGNIIFRSDNGSGGVAEYIVVDGGSGAVNLKYYGNTKFETTNTGVSVTGDIISSAIVQAKGFRTETGSTDYSLLSRNSTNTAAYIQQAGNGPIVDFRYGSQAAGQGTSAMLIKSDGDVGIGTTSPTEKLHIINDSGNTNIRVYDSSSNSEVGLQLQSDAKTWTLQNWGSGGDNLRFLNNAGTSIMLLDEDGSIGIGTTDPDFTGFGWNVLTIQGGTGAGNAGVLELATPSTNANNQNLGIVSFNSGTNRNAQIAANRESADNDGRLTFWTSPGSGIEERMRITKDGNVGIGTASIDAVLKIANNDSSSYRFGYGGTSDVYLDSDNIYIRSDNGGANRYTFTSTGLGIGTTSPGNILHVSSAGADTYVRIGNNAGYDAGIYFNTSADWTIGTDTSNSNAFTIGNGSSVGASAKLTIQTGGNIGIGYDNPQARLDIQDNTGTPFMTRSSSGLAMFNEISNGYSYLYLYQIGGGAKVVLSTNGNSYFTGGNVGIGTTSPQNKFVVANGTSNTQNIEIAPNYIQSFNRQSGNLGYASLDFYASSYTFNVADVLIGTHGKFLQGRRSTSSTVIDMIGFGAGTDNLQIKGGTSGAANAISFYDTGGFLGTWYNSNFGIGIGTPQAKLQVNGAVNTFSAHFGGQNNTNGQFQGISLGYAEGSNASYRKVAIVTQAKGDGAARQDLHFLVDTVSDSNSAGIADSKMHIRYNTGNVIINNNLGIGTTSASVPLQVHGQQKWYTTNADGNELRGFFNPGGSGDDAEFSVYKDDGATEGVVWRGTGNSYIRIDSTSLKFINFYYGISNVGQIVTGGSNVLYQSNSDYRLKENVVEMTGALDRVSQLKPSRYNFISHPGEQVDGFMAHELQEIVPQAVSGEKDEINEDGTPKYQGIDHSQIVPLLVGAIKELKAEIEQLKTQING